MASQLATIDYKSHRYIHFYKSLIYLFRMEEKLFEQLDDVKKELHQYSVMNEIQSIIKEINKYESRLEFEGIMEDN